MTTKLKTIEEAYRAAEAIREYAYAHPASTDQVEGHAISTLRHQAACTVTAVATLAGIRDMQRGSAEPTAERSAAPHPMTVGAGA